MGAVGVAWRGRSGRLAAVAFIAAAALVLVPAVARAASPVLEVLTPGSSFPVGFTTEGGPLRAEMAGFGTLVHCERSEGKGEITGPHSASGSFRFTGCTAGGAHCHSEGAGEEEEITTGQIDAELVYIDQARHEAGILLNPGGATYIEFRCGGVLVEGRGAFLARVGTVNQESASFTATLSTSGEVQIPDEYENASGEALTAIPQGLRESNPVWAPTGVESTFTIDTSRPLDIRAISREEVEAKQREEEARQREQKQHEEEAAARKHQEEEAATKHHEEEVAAKKRQEEEAVAVAAKAARPKSKPLTRTQLLAKALHACERGPKKRRARCEATARRTYGCHGHHSLRSGIRLRQTGRPPAR